MGYTIGSRVSDNLLIPPVVAGIGGVAFHRHRGLTPMSRLLGLQVHEFPFPIGTLGIDVVWNPWLSDERLRAWLGAVLRDAAAGPTTE